MLSWARPCTQRKEIARSECIGQNRPRKLALAIGEQDRKRELDVKGPCSAKHNITAYGRCGPRELRRKKGGAVPALTYLPYYYSG